MVNQQLLDYIRGQVQRGQSVEMIKQELLKVGWQTADIEEALKAVDSTRLPDSYSSVSSSPVQERSSIPATLPGVGDLLKRAFSVYKARLGTLVGIMAIPLVISCLAPIAISFVQLSSSSTSLLVPFLLSIILGLMVAVINLWTQISLIFAIRDREEKIGIIESFRKGWHKIISFVWISFLVGFITLGGSALFIIPGIIFSIWFAFSVYILISEDLRGMNALFRSKQLVAGYWWKVLWRFFVLNCIIFLFYGVFIIAELLVYFSAPPLAIFDQPALNAISYLFALFITPFTIIFGLLLYEDLKRQKAEVVFEPPKKGTKIKFILIGIAGFLLIPVIFFSIILVSLGGAKEKAQEARVMADMSQIRAAIEIYSVKNNDSYNGADCSLSELAPICGDIKHYTDEMLTIESSEQNYCFYVKLPSGEYLCSTAVFSGRKTTIFPGEPGYCDGMTFNCP